MKSRQLKWTKGDKNNVELEKRQLTKPTSKKNTRNVLPKIVSQYTSP